MLPLVLCSYESQLYNKSSSSNSLTNKVNVNIIILKFAYSFIGNDLFQKNLKDAFGYNISLLYRMLYACAMYIR